MASGGPAKQPSDKGGEREDLTNGSKQKRVGWTHKWGWEREDLTNGSKQKRVGWTHKWGLEREDLKMAVNRRGWGRHTSGVGRGRI